MHCAANPYGVGCGADGKTQLKFPTGISATGIASPPGPAVNGTAGEVLYGAVAAPASAVTSAREMSVGVVPPPPTAAAGPALSAPPLSGAAAPAGGSGAFTFR